MASAPATIRPVALVDVLSDDPPPKPSPGRPAPLVPAAIGLIAGILIDFYFVPPLTLNVVVLILGTGIAFTLSRRSTFAVAGIMLATLSLGCLRHDLAFRRLPADHIYRVSRAEPFIAQIRGRVISTPQVIELDASIPRAFETPPRTKFILEATEIAGERGPIPVVGQVSVSIKAPVLLLSVGDTVAMTGWLYRLPRPKNPGEYDRALDQRRSGIWLAFSADEAESVRIAGAGKSPVSTLLTRLRTHLAQYLIHDAFDEEDVGSGVMQAMVLGQRGAVPRAMNDAFIRTGNAHFLAASGMNVGWLALMAWFVMRLLGVYYRTTAIIIAFLIVTYTLAAEPEPSILRAGIIGVLGCFALFIRGRPNILNWLACSAIIVLLIDPCDLFRPGFQLSFLAVLAVMHVSPIVLDWLCRPRWVRRHVILPESIAADYRSRPLVLLLDEQQPHLWRNPKWLIGLLLAALSVSIACFITTAPLSCYHFNQFAPWGLIGTFILWIPAFIATLIGYAKVALGLILPSSSILFGPLLSASTALMTGTVNLLSRLPFALLDGHSPSLAWIIACYAWLGWCVYRRRPKTEAAKSEMNEDEIADGTRARRSYSFIFASWRFGFPVFLMAWWLIPVRWVTHDANALEIRMLAVGDGSANVIELPDGRVYLFDFGTRSSFDVGNLAVNFLRQRGIKRIDAAFISHADFDHYSALPRIADEIPISRLILNDQFEPSALAKPAVKRLLATLREHHVSIETVHGPTQLDKDGVVIDLLWPPPLADGLMKHDNDSSTVLRITYEGHSVLLPGDIADEAMSRLLSKSSPKADALALPHHGSVVRNTRAFVDAVNPAICVRSTAQRRSMTTNEIQDVVHSRQYFSTADDGCILVEIKNGKISARAVITDRADSLPASN